MAVLSKSANILRSVILDKKIQDLFQKYRDQTQCHHYSHLLSICWLLDGPGITEPEFIDEKCSSKVVNSISQTIKFNAVKKRSKAYQGI